MSIRSAAIGLAAVVVLMSAAAAQSLAGSNTVDSGDIINGQVYNPDIHDRAVTGAKVLNDSLSGSDINESTLVPTCPIDMTRYGDVCVTEPRGPHTRTTAAVDCTGESLRLPSVGEAEVIARLSSQPEVGWTDALYYDGTENRGVAVYDSGTMDTFVSTGSSVKYRCVISVGARP